MTHRDEAKRQQVIHEALARQARSHRPADPWLETLPDALARALDAFGLTITGHFDSGVQVPVMEVVDDAGRPGVLKLAEPGGELDAEARVMVAASGVGYAPVLGWDAGLGALLLERMGEGVWTRPWPEIIDICGRLLPDCWQVPLSAGWPHDKASSLLGFLDDLGPRFGGGHDAALSLAAEIARHLAATERAEVVCHGDPHPGNALVRPGGGFAYVDPDGFLGERAYDLGTLMRDWCGEVLGGQPEVIDAGCRTLGERTGVAPERIAQWAFLERCTTGLHLALLGYPEQSASFLGAADVLAASWRD